MDRLFDRVGEGDFEAGACAGEGNRWEDGDTGARLGGGERVGNGLNDTPSPFARRISTAVVDPIVVDGDAFEEEGIEAMAGTVEEEEEEKEEKEEEEEEEESGDEFSNPEVSTIPSTMSPSNPFSLLSNHVSI
jgi:hypothetical protein